MSIVVIGLNHRTSPLEVLERATIADEMLPKALHGIAARDDVREVVVLSTCNRTEIYAVTERYHAAYADIRDFLCEQSGLVPDDLQPHLYSQHDDAAIAHLFGVAAGLDSAVLGESEVLGQVKTAWERARTEGTARSTLNQLFRHALEVGKRARTETGIARSTASVSYAAVEMAEEIVGSLAGARVLVIGAGEMGEGVATALSRAGAEITVVNRTESRAVDLARRVGARVSPAAMLESEIAGSDVCLTCTGAGEHLVTKEMLERARAGSERSLLLIDIALPRDVEPAVTEVAGVSLRDLHDLNDWVARGRDQRAGEAHKVAEIVTEEVDRCLMEYTARQAAPLLAQLRDRAETVRRGETERFARRLADLSPEQREVVESITRGIVAKLLHGPSVKLKDSAGTPQGDRLLSAIRDLFDLD